MQLRQNLQETGVVANSASMEQTTTLFPTVGRTRVLLAYLLTGVFAAALLGQAPAEPVAPQNQPPPSTRRASDTQRTPGTPGTPGMQGMQGMQMTCCPPSAMSKMMDKPGGMAMMWVCMALAAALFASVIAVLIALAMFLVRRSRVAAVAVK